MASKNVRILALALVFSVFLNISLLASLAFYDHYDPPGTVCRTSRTDCEATNAEMFQFMAKLSFRELVSYLTNREPVEEGFCKRDLALACLTAFHHFNLEKAIAGQPTQIRTVQFSEKESVDLFPGLSDDQFEALIRYAYQEKWPLTTRGLFLQLQRKAGSRDESLEQAFFVTTEFHALQTLFQKTGAPQDPTDLLQMICEGSWECLDGFGREQARMLDFSLEKRRALLLSYLSLRSPVAAALLLRTDFAFALKRFEDRGILDLLALLPESSEETNRFCVELLRSPRSDAVRQKAAAVLYAHSGKMPEMTAPEIASVFHTVKEGETLWKISRQYKVNVDELAKLNELDKNAVFPGMTLKIPQGTGS